MDTKLCVLLDLNLIIATIVYTQGQICTIIANNQAAFDAVYYDTSNRTAVRDEYLETAQSITIIDKSEDCG